MTTRKDTPAGHRTKHRGEAMGHAGCPPHGPLVVAASAEGHYAASCLACGLRGPERYDGWEAKVAFDEAVQPPPV